MAEPALRALSVAIDRYPHTAALFEGRVASPLLRLRLAEIAPISKAFAPMIREQRFDVSEMAIATFLQARAWGHPLVLLPVTLAARFQEGALLCRADSEVRGPEHLRGRRVGVRAYSQTTGMWLRGILTETHGVGAEDIAWTTFEDAHVPEYADPPWARRAPAGADMLAMLRAGELDAAVFGNELPEDAALRPVFANPAAAGEAFRARHGFVPVNHLVVARAALAAEAPALLEALVELFAAARGDAALPHGRVALEPAIGLALRYMGAQGMLPRALSLDEVWNGLPSRIA